MDNKQEVLSDLYTLRAGLSIISGYSDKVRNVKENYDNEAKNCMRDVYPIFEDYGSWRYNKNGESKAVFNFYTPQELESFAKRGLGIQDHKASDNFIDDCYHDMLEFTAVHRDVLEEWRKKYAQKVNEFDVEISKTQDDIKNDRKGVYIYRNVKATLILLALLAVLSLVVGVYLGPELWGFSLIVEILCLVVSGVFAVLFIVKLFKNISTPKQRRKLDEWSIEYNTSKSAPYRSGLEILDKCLNDLPALRSTMQQEVQLNRSLGDKVYNILVEQFSKTLDPRDWQYVDLLIFYFETGRAESMREALQLVDKEMQTQQIVGSIKAATVMICRTIQSEMSALRSTVRDGFSSLQQSINSGFASLQKSIATNNALLQQQISEEQLANALLKKSNSTSEQLMNDVHYLRERLY